MPSHFFQTLFQSLVSCGVSDCKGWYCINPWGPCSPFIFGTPTSIKNWKTSWFWVRGRWQTVEGDVVPEIVIPTQYNEYSESSFFVVVLCSVHLFFIFAKVCFV